MNKSWLSYDDQVSLLIERGLYIDDPSGAAEFLSQVSYFRLSGYFRYWQHDPQNGDDRFIEGASFDVFRSLYDAEGELIRVLDEVLHPLEVLLRTRFAHAYSDNVGTPGKFAHGEGFTQSPNPNAERVEEHALRNLDRSKEAFVAHYRGEATQDTTYKPEAYDRMPIWVAVEAFSFGSISRLIEASGQSGVLDSIAESMSASRKYLPGQVRSFVYLRNRVSHCSRLWNHSVLDTPGLPSKIARRAKQRYRAFSEHSIYKILVALDYVATRSRIRTAWLESTVEPILRAHPLLAYGIASPSKYGEMPEEILCQSV